MMTWPKFKSPYVGIEPPPSVRIPKLKELLDRIGVECPGRAYVAYPPEIPTCWIKYGLSVYWNEVCAQVVAYDGLRQLGSSVRAPAVFYAFEKYPMTYIVMEYIPGKIASQCLKECQEHANKEAIYRSIALALSDFQRIPIPASNNRPSRSKAYSALPRLGLPYPTFSSPPPFISSTHHRQQPPYR